MNLTFGIITYRSENGNVDKSIDSIEAQGMSDYEIIVVGDYTGFRKNKNVSNLYRVKLFTNLCNFIFIR